MRDLRESKSSPILVGKLYERARRMVGHNGALSAFAPPGPIVPQFNYRMLKQSASSEYRQIRVSA